MDLQGLNEEAVSTAGKLGADDAVSLGVRSADRMIRFANSSVTVVNQVEEAELTVYLAKNKRRAIASTSNLDSSSVKKFVRDLFGSLKGLPVSEYVPLPEKATKFSASRVSYDKRLVDMGEALPGLAKSAIEASHEAGGKRSAGVIDAGVVTYSILTSAGARGTDSRTAITLNIRSFAQKDASGHGLSCSSSLAGFQPAEAGRRAGHDAKKMVESSEPEAGTYEVLLSPTVASNIVETVAGAASAFAVDAGTSYLAEKLGKKVASRAFSLTDHGITQGGLGGRVFDDEGSPTGTTKVIERGTLKGYFHNLTTAKKWKTKTTGSAGLVTPHPWNIEVGQGDSNYDEMLKEMKRGIILTSNWYTRFKNYRTGEFSTVPRDGAYLVENGKVVKSLKGMRAGGDLLRFFSSVRLLSKSREWIEWWEVDTPTLCPWMLVDGVKVTRAYE
ncbi:MAG: TldD/PmbA family protein [archaeon]|nr:MAG: TldD/PmbA family protein [archaeon]